MPQTRRTFLQQTSLLAAALPLANLKLSAATPAGGKAATVPVAPAAGRYGVVKKNPCCQ